jgi:transcriptional activator SPT8
MAHGAQVASVAVRPLVALSARAPSPMEEDPTPVSVHMPANHPPVSNLIAPTNAEPAPADAQAPATDISMASEDKSEASYDPLFDDYPDPSLPEPDATAPLGDVSTLDGLLSIPETFDLALPGGPDMPLWDDISAPNTLPLPAAPLREYPRNLAPQMPPLLEGSRAQEMSPDVLMTASIDGQVIIWDRRVLDSRGVGRLPMNNGTPPWCVSVSSASASIHRIKLTAI